ncbi:hypothetical protein BASA83_001545 [Batrachochytrium salamandrivorans]|nr:hypothetical protein BASA83_001545 [Batrachochytrium salamandrivorans]
MANSDISVSSVDHRQEPSTSTTFSIYGLAAVSNQYLRSILAPILGHQMEHVSKIDRAYHKTRCSIPHNGPLKTDNAISSSASSAKASKPTGVFGKTTDIAVQISLDQQPHLHHYHGRSSQSMLPTSATNVLLSAISSGTPGSGPSQRPASPHLNFALLYLVRCHPASSHGTWTQRNRPSSSTELFQFDNNHPVLSSFGDWNTRPTAPSAHRHSWGHGLTVMQFSGSQITRLSTVHGRRHSSIDHLCVMHQPAHCSPRHVWTDRQQWPTFVIRTSIRAEAQGQPPAPRAPTISRHHCLEATDRIATSITGMLLADGAIG